jgi:Fe-S-cluster-containing hydrogenase component 2
MSFRPKWWLDVLRLYWPLNTLSAKMMSWPVAGRFLSFILLPLVTKKNFNISYLPVNANIEPVASSALNRKIIEELIRRSSHRIIIKRCSCRDSKKCKNFPAEDSCLLLGEDTNVVDPRIADHVSVNEALDHTNKKIASGLIPMVGRVRMDDFFYGIPNRGRMLTVCFCCPCCCSILSTIPYLPAEAKSSIVRLKNVAVVVDAEKCMQCRHCIDACFAKAITLSGDRIHHDDHKCIGCGRCSMVCPQQATSLVVENVDAAINEILGRIKERVNVE